MGRLTHRTASGSSYFVTTKTWGNRRIFQVEENAEILIQAMLRYRTKGDYLLHEFVVMPNHLHLLLTPSDSISLEKAIRLIKGGSSFDIHKRRGAGLEIWQPGFFESTIRNAADYSEKAEYIRQNPVNAKLVENPEDWACGSARQNCTLDPWPPLSSGAKAGRLAESSLSELKLRPPKAGVHAV